MSIITDAERMKFLADKMFACVQQDKNMQKLFTKLLKHGGQFVVSPIVEEDLKKLLSRGEFFSYSVLMARGERCQCHRNACSVWRNNFGVKLITGYALSEDNPVWVQHSWCYREGRIIETTERRIAYFGYVMGPREAKKFYEENI